MAQEFDLLGDVIPEGFGKPGAPEHVATAENVSKIRLLVLAGWVGKQIAGEIGVSLPTLNKHYFKNRSIKLARSHCIAEAKGLVLLQLQKEAAAGNVSAQKEIWKIIEKVEISDISALLPARGKSRSKKGKKEIGDQAAIDAAGTKNFLPKYGPN